ncbi:hypothetical protein EV180_007495 [Coemansia sp. RSA 518]|nr:hypothetical protein EV181_007930 [Coemansia sp. RSA 532]KAJ2203704.1 hypothetical protein EV180_007495 [Coemansia sp. RSA 518]
MAKQTSRLQSGGRMGGDSLSADPTMYPQTNIAATLKSSEQPVSKCPMQNMLAANTRPKSVTVQVVSEAQDVGRLARKLEDGAVARGTGGTDAIQFLKQVRNETAQTRI